MVSHCNVGCFTDSNHIQHFVRRVCRPITARIDGCAKQCLRRRRQTIKFNNTILQFSITTLDQTKVRDCFTCGRSEILKFDLQLVSRKWCIRIRALKTSKIVAEDITSWCGHGQITFDVDIKPTMAKGVSDLPFSLRAVRSSFMRTYAAPDKSTSTVPILQVRKIRRNPEYTHQ